MAYGILYFTAIDIKLYTRKGVAFTQSVQKPAFYPPFFGDNPCQNIKNA